MLCCSHIEFYKLYPIDIFESPFSGLLKSLIEQPPFSFLSFANMRCLLLLLAPVVCWSCCLLGAGASRADTTENTSSGPQVSGTTVVPPAVIVPAPHASSTTSVTSAPAPTSSFNLENTTHASSSGLISSSLHAMSLHPQTASPETPTNDNISSGPSTTTVQGHHTPSTLPPAPVAMGGCYKMKSAWLGYLLVGSAAVAVLGCR